MGKTVEYQGYKIQSAPYPLADGETYLRGAHAFHDSPLPPLPCAMCRHVQRWHIPQAAAGLLFGFWVMSA